MKKNLLTISAVCLIFACTSSYEPIQFESYEYEASVTSPDGGMAGMTLHIDIPVGEGEVQNRVTEGIRTIIRKSEVGQELKQPVEGSLKEFGDALIAYFQKGVESGEVEAGGLSYDLSIECAYQNPHAVFFHVKDGIYGNGGPGEGVKVVRLSDGRVMEGEEITSIKADDVIKMVQKYGSEEQKDLDAAFLADVAYLYPTADSCKVLYLYGAHFWNTIMISKKDAAQYLTDEGKVLFDINGESRTDSKKTESDVQKEDTKVSAEPGRGELGIFDLRGSVKECTWGSSDNKTTRTFDKDGFWLTHDGRKLNDLFPGGVERNKDKQIKDGWADGYGSCHYTYNAQGLATKIVEDGSERLLTYDEEGYVKSEVFTIFPEVGDEESSPEVIKYNYTIVEKDEIGNWVKRKDQRDNIETRTIVYY